MSNARCFCFEIPGQLDLWYWNAFSKTAISKTLKTAISNSKYLSIIWWTWCWFQTRFEIAVISHIPSQNPPPSQAGSRSNVFRFRANCFGHGALNYKKAIDIVQGYLNPQWTTALSWIVIVYNRMCLQFENIIWTLIETTFDKINCLLCMVDRKLPSIAFRYQLKLTALRNLYW